MRSSKNENITKEEHLYIKLAAYSALIEFNQHILPVLSNFNQIINSTSQNTEAMADTGQ